MEKIEPLGDFKDAAPESICAAVAKTFRVRGTEVALLELKRKLLTFLYPAELKTAGAIPLSSSAVAARTARTNRAELFNTFTGVRHSSVFEVVKVGEAGQDTEVIQKLMSAPLLSPGGEVIGVIQVSRKAHSPAAAGPDFTTEDLVNLKSIAASVGKAMSEAGDEK